MDRLTGDAACVEAGVSAVSAVGADIVAIGFAEVSLNTTQDRLV